jgi:small subunit ribosomal protein S4
MRYTGPRNRVARRNGVDLELKTPGTKSHASLLKRISTPPGQHGASTRRKLSEHAKQLREKQKMRMMFGVSERQMTNYFDRAKKKKGNTGTYLCEFLEARLDNAVYRSGFAPTRAAARQLVTHGHITVNDKLLTIPSYEISPGEIIGLKNEATAAIPAVGTALARKDIVSPGWVKREGTKSKIMSAPTSETIEKLLNVRLIIEFYSK